MERGRFYPLSAYLPNQPPASGDEHPGRRVLIDVTAGRGSTSDIDPSLKALAENLKQELEGDFGHTVTILENHSESGQLKSPDGLSETPAIPPADCWIGLRLETYPGQTREFLMVVPGPAPHLDHVLPVSPTGVRVNEADAAQNRGAAAGDVVSGARFGALRWTRLAPWSQVPRLSEAESRKLATTLAEHLGGSWSGRTIRIASRPARVFRGIAVPAVLIYPAQVGDSDAEAALADTASSGELSRNLAYALDEFLVGLGTEPPR